MCIAVQQGVRRTLSMRINALISGRTRGEQRDVLVSVASMSLVIVMSASGIYGPALV